MRLHPNRIVNLILCFIIPIHMFSMHPQQRRFLNRLSNTWQQRFQAEYETARIQAELHGYPIRTVTPDGVVIELQGLDHGRPMYYTTHNMKAAETIATDKIWSNGSWGYDLTGRSQTPGMWESGIPRLDHYEFGGRIVSGDATGIVSEHATHTAGTLIAAGIDVQARGMAFEAELTCYDWADDLAEMAAAAADGLTLSNHSYGPHAGWLYNAFGDNRWCWHGDPAISETEDYQFGYYLERARLWDDLAVQAPEYLMVVSAGNDRSERGPLPDVAHWVYRNSGWELVTQVRDPDGGNDGYDSINGFAVAKNVLTVGAVQPFQSCYQDASDVLMTIFSGWGPTDDGRIKPDITADGLSIYSTSSAAQNAYDVRNGTSCAAPSVTGSIALLKEHYKALNPGSLMLSSTLKALVIHTAREAGPGPGPDYQFGWGVMNTAGAVDLISMNAAAEVSPFIRELVLSNGGSLEIDVTVSGEEPFRATMCWTDPAGPMLQPALNQEQAILVNDLDIRVTGPVGDAGATQFAPWVPDPDNPSAAVRTGDNVRDNTEQIVIETPEAGVYRIRISHKGSLESGTQALSLILSGTILPEVDAPQAVVLTAPVNGAVIESGETDLEWAENPEAVSYELQMAQDPAFSQYHIHETGIHGSMFPMEGLTQDLNLYWRIIAISPGGRSVVSETRNFSVGQGAMPMVWEKITPPELDYFVREICVNNKGYIFAVIEPPGNNPDYPDIVGTYRSVDQGMTWKKMTIDFQRMALDSRGHVLSIGSYIYDLGIDGNVKMPLFEPLTMIDNSEGRDILIHDNMIYAIYSGGYIVRSRDNGLTWHQWSKIPDVVEAIQDFSWAGDRMCVATWGQGVFCTADSGKTWQNISFDSGIRYVYTVEGSRDGKYLLGTLTGLYTSPMDVLNWQEAQNGTIEHAKISSIVVKDCGVIYAGNYGCQGVGYGVFVSADHGETWMSLNQGLNHQSTFVLRESPQGDIYIGIGTGDPSEGGAVYRGSLNKAMEVVGRKLGLTVPGLCTPVLPPDDSVQDWPTVLLQWSAAAGACKYEIQVSPGPDFVELHYTGSADGTELTAGPLAGDTRYYWRVRSVNAMGHSDWSEARSFTTTTGPAVLPGTVVLELPEDNCVLENTEVNLTWVALENVQGYQVQVSETPDFQGCVYDEILQVTDTEAILPEPNTPYYWRVRSVLMTGSGFWSAVRSFTTGTDLVNAESGMITPDVFALYPNFPNPFNCRTTVTYDLPEKTVVSLIIYDVKGREAAVLVHGIKDPGTHCAVFEGQSLPSGIYILRMTAGPFRKSSKLMLMK
ncbi:S8 family serine peptidase [bacterium]|nr:S8 family serine peptidase [bacterium]